MIELLSSPWIQRIGLVLGGVLLGILAERVLVRQAHRLAARTRFKWDDLVTIEDHQKMEEKKHILIETDGRWFRVVETDNPYVIPPVNQTRRGDGTRWIKARH